MRFWLAVAIGAPAPTLAAAQPATWPVVDELFTSEGWASSPPANAKVAELTRTRPDLLLLTFRVLPPPTDLRYCMNGVALTFKAV